MELILQKTVPVNTEKKEKKNNYTRLSYFQLKLLDALQNSENKGKLRIENLNIFFNGLYRKREMEEAINILYQHGLIDFDNENIYLNKNLIDLTVLNNKEISKEV